MIIGRSDLVERLEHDLVIEPPPSDKQLQPASIDFRLGSEYYVPATDRYYHADAIDVEPGQFLLGSTIETIELPTDVAAFLTGRSTIGRQGLMMHVTAGFVDPGFCGQLTFEMVNVSADPICVHTGDRIAQLVLVELSTDEQYDGQYQEQHGPTDAGSL
jgi:dCTP deaminase